MTDDLDSLNSNTDGGTPAPAPEGLPEQFWDGQAGSVKLPEMIKAYGEAAAFKAQHDERLAALPKEPKDYKVELEWPDKLSDDGKARLLGVPVPDGFQLSVNPDDPRIGPFREWAHEHRLSQEQVNDLLWLQARGRAAAIAQADAELQAEVGKLGTNAKERIAAVETALAGHLTEAEYEAIRGYIDNAPALAAIEKLLAKVSAVPRPQSNGAGRSAAERIWPGWK